MSDCSAWNLQWPTNPFLSCLKESYNLPPVPPMPLENVLGYATVPAKRAGCHEVDNLLMKMFIFMCFVFVCFVY